eukprot:TRINITY_DN11675_c0_g6_i1.p1 TRINITY_DN11675_c0_g6~~TRINITY_DN11675_c0_g6_i1.p1  ORF type:complete len:420 (+),score=77.08 TRINITY_DN11675_c0_g6_i1:898-2157(+)
MSLNQEVSGGRQPAAAAPQAFPIQGDDSTAPPPPAVLVPRSSAYDSSTKVPTQDARLLRALVPGPAVTGTAGPAFKADELTCYWSQQRLYRSVVNYAAEFPLVELENDELLIMIQHGPSPSLLRVRDRPGRPRFVCCKWEHLRVVPLNEEIAVPIDPVVVQHDDCVETHNLKLRFELLRREFTERCMSDRLGQLQSQLQSMQEAFQAQLHALQAQQAETRAQLNYHFEGFGDVPSPSVEPVVVARWKDIFSAPASEGPELVSVLAAICAEPVPVDPLLIDSNGIVCSTVSHLWAIPAERTKVMFRCTDPSTRPTFKQVRERLCPLQSASRPRTFARGVRCEDCVVVTFCSNTICAKLCFKPRPEDLDGVPQDTDNGAVLAKWDSVPLDAFVWTPHVTKKRKRSQQSPLGPVKVPNVSQE